MPTFPFTHAKLNINSRNVWAMRKTPRCELFSRAQRIYLQRVWRQILHLLVFCLCDKCFRLLIFLHTDLYWHYAFLCSFLQFGRILFVYLYRDSAFIHSFMDKWVIILIIHALYDANEWRLFPDIIYYFAAIIEAQIWILLLIPLM